MQKAMFFDLQGTLGGDFLGDIRTFEFYSFAIEALKKAKKKGYLVFIITNQSRIAKGFLTQESYQYHENRLIEEMKQEGFSVDGFYSCPHKRDECDCKKPKPGMIDQAMKTYDIDIRKSYIVGDLGSSDILLAKNVGCKSILVLTGGGRSSLDTYRNTWANTVPTHIADHVLEGVNMVQCVSKTATDNLNT